MTGIEASPAGEPVSGFGKMHSGLPSLPFVLLLAACSGSTAAAPLGTGPAPEPVTRLGPFQLGMSAVDLRLACAESDGRDWLPNRHAFTRGCEVTVDVEGVTYQRFEMRLDGPAGNLMRIRGHAEHADAQQAAEAFPGAEIVVVEDVVLVTVEVATSEAPTQARGEAARPPE